MRKITLIGFEGTGFRNPLYREEPGLIRAGHVGFAFEDEEEQIYGFHPNPDAIKHAGGETEVLQLLLQGKYIDGTIQEDIDIFNRAAELAEFGARTKVWQLHIMVNENDFERIRSQAREWYTKQEIFQYAFPRRETPLTDEKDNCATFPRRLGLPLPESTGQVSRYVEVMMIRGHRWWPK